MAFNPNIKGNVTRILIGIIVAVIIGIYYFSEVRPFSYENYEKDINLLQRYDAELNQAIVLTRFGIIHQYSPIDKALNGIQAVLDEFNEELKKKPNTAILVKLKALENSVAKKETLSQHFKRINPILVNAINQFSTILAQIIESQASIQLVESCLEQEYIYHVVDKMNNLFRGILVYINLGTVDQREYLLDLVQQIREAPQKFDNLDLALSYADKILELQPTMTSIDTQLFEVPIVEKLNALNDAYNNAFENYLSDSFAYRVLLYILVFVLLVILRWAFSQLRGTVKTLHIEVQRKIRAENALAKINRQLEQRVADRTQELSKKNEDLNSALEHLKEAQDQLIMQEKMASVGMLTTGIAHEIKNPLNFVNNFSDLSIDLVSDIDEEIKANKEKLDEDSISAIDEMITDLKSMCKKIKQHGVRADNIVKTMLQHSQETGVEKQNTSMKNLLEENYQITLNSFISTHGEFTVEKVAEYSDTPIEAYVAPQSISRVLTYIFDNAFYAMREKAKTAGQDYHPTLTIELTKTDQMALIKIKDNGTGIAKANMDKIFEPFYTTKPTGKGNTGLGLSICYDTVVKQHKGELKVVSEEGQFTEFQISLPVGKTSH